MGKRYNTDTRFMYRKSKTMAGVVNHKNEESKLVFRGLDEAAIALAHKPLAAPGKWVREMPTIIAQTMNLQS